MYEAAGSGEVSRTVLFSLGGGSFEVSATPVTSQWTSETRSFSRGTSRSSIMSIPDAVEPHAGVLTFGILDMSVKFSLTYNAPYKAGLTTRMHQRTRCMNGARPKDNI
jgi:hypothetical protein